MGRERNWFPGEWAAALLPGPDKHSRPHSPKTTAIVEAFTATYLKNLLLHDISKHNNNKKHKNIMFGEGFSHFLISALHFWIKHYTNFLNLTKFVSQHLTATHGYFHRHQFFTANYFLYGRF
jgi:hypothetical protein